MMTFASLLLGNEWARLAAVALLCFGFGWVRGFDAVPKVDAEQVKLEAVTARDNEWKLRLAEESAHHEERIAAALEAAQGISVAADADLVSLCNKSADCRDKGGQRK